MKYEHHNPQSSKKRNANTNAEIRRLLRQGEIIGTNFPFGNSNIQYGKIRDIELVITVSNGVVIKVEEF